MTEPPGSKRPPAPEPNRTEGSVLRLHCPFCRAEYPLWFRPDGDTEDTTMTPADWERWLDTPCAECGRRPREQVSQDLQP